MPWRDDPDLRRAYNRSRRRAREMDWVRIERFLDHRIAWADLSRADRAELVRRSRGLSIHCTAVQLRTTERTVLRWRAKLRQRQAA